MLTPTAEQVLMTLDKLNIDQRQKLKIVLLAKWSGVSRCSAIRAIKLLKDRGLIKTSRAAVKGPDAVYTFELSSEAIYVAGNLRGVSERVS